MQKETNIEQIYNIYNIENSQKNEKGRNKQKVKQKRWNK